MGEEGSGGSLLAVGVGDGDRDAESVADMAMAVFLVCLLSSCGD